MRPGVLLVLALLPLAACSTTTATDSTFTGSPRLSLVGEGIDVKRAPLPAHHARDDVRSANSLWSHDNPGLYRDRRAHRVGDILTVNIDIDDRAQFDNTSERSKGGNVIADFATKLLWGFGSSPQEGDASGDLSAGGKVSATGAGKIDRSERLSLSIAAIVTEVLPDGNLLIAGSQEVRVNREVRVLNIAGIVRPLDINGANQISYEKIAEARISYGGRGKLSVVQ